MLFLASSLQGPVSPGPRGAWTEMERVGRGGMARQTPTCARQAETVGCWQSVCVWMVENEGTTHDDPLAQVSLARLTRDVLVRLVVVSTARSRCEFHFRSAEARIQARKAFTASTVLQPLVRCVPLRRRRAFASARYALLGVQTSKAKSGAIRAFRKQGGTRTRTRTRSTTRRRRWFSPPARRHAAISPPSCAGKSLHVLICRTVVLITLARFGAAGPDVPENPLLALDWLRGVIGGYGGAVRCRGVASAWRGVLAAEAGHEG
ncbi:hypothetical protein SVAN01_02119 [Stagonosporopsis vannaccii]|nr:hypothetical protein SVAN01_02119 [Stagonosporopsis vannaccii]